MSDMIFFRRDAESFRRLDIKGCKGRGLSELRKFSALIKKESEDVEK